jgi:hypothetical protein
MSDKRIHGIEAAGAGDAGDVVADEVVGPCPSCGAELLACHVTNPITKRVERALMHPVPFCSYYGETDPSQIERDMQLGVRK